MDFRINMTSNLHDITDDVIYKNSSFTFSPPIFDPNCTNREVINPEYDSLLIQQARLRTGILASYLVTMVVGLIGNSLVIFIIGKNSHIRNKSVANYYIWNLAFADLMFLLTLPFFCYSTFYDSWPFGVVVCKMAFAFKETMRYNSMFTLVALSFDRYLASYYNMAHLRTIKVGIVVCCATWVLSVSIAIPYAMYANVRHYQCVLKRPTGVMMFMTYFQLAAALLIPLLLINVSYVLLALRLREILRSSAIRSAAVNRSNRKMTRTVFVVVITFLVWQTPYHVTSILNLQKHLEMSGGDGRRPTVQDKLTAMYLNTVSTILVFISSCCNPIIYGILNENYRALYTSALCCCCVNKTSLGRTSLSGDHSQKNPAVRKLCHCLHTDNENDVKVKVRELSMGTSMVNTEQMPLNGNSAEHKDKDEAL